MNLKNALGQIEADRANLHRGWLPSLWRFDSNHVFWHLDAGSGSHPPGLFWTHWDIETKLTGASRSSLKTLAAKVRRCGRLFVMLRGAKAFDVGLPANLLGYFERVAERPTVRRALAEEGLA